MSSNNINDPIGVKALLEQLRVSQAWQQLQSVHQNDQEATSNTSSSALTNEGKSGSDHSDIIEAGSPSAGSTVADLLAQLKAPVQPTSTESDADIYQPTIRGHSISYAVQYKSNSPPRNLPSAPSLAVSASPERHETADARSCTFQEALTMISRLGDHQSFLASIREMRKDQDDLENQLWADRNAIQQKYIDKVKVAETKASLVGTRISKHEATMLQDAYQQELHKFDQDRVLPAWDGLVSRQQATMESLMVPNMFLSSDSKDKERQLQIVQILVGLAGSTGN